jgi:hypothetical protein
MERTTTARLFEVAEIELVYKTKVKASARLQITSSRVLMKFY